MWSSFWCKVEVAVLLPYSLRGSLGLPGHHGKACRSLFCSQGTRLQLLAYVKVWDPGVIWGQLFKVCFLYTNIILVSCHLLTCIISLMDAQKHVFGTYIFVYLAICVCVFVFVCIWLFGVLMDVWIAIRGQIMRLDPVCKVLPLAGPHKKHYSVFIVQCFYSALY